MRKLKAKPYGNVVINEEDVSGVTFAERQAFTTRIVKLNGDEANISGTRMKFATVSTVCHSVSHQWSWNAVKRIVGSGGNFSTL